MKVIVCGGRDYDDPENIYRVLNEIKPDIVVHGACTGADTHADDWCMDNSVEVIHYPANWLEYGRFAGPLRNQEMLDKEKPDLVVAFPGGKGTASMIKLAKKANVEVRDES